MAKAAFHNRPPPTPCRERAQLETAIEDLTDDFRRIQAAADFLLELILQGDEHG